MIHGILNVYKEKGYTSHDVVAKLRGIAGQKKIGHTGTLDPDAEGVLPVCLGKATKVCDLLTDRSKTYEAVLLLGKVTDTQDTSGECLETHDTSSLTGEKVEQVLSGFTGLYMQVPPMYSALKVNGKKLYELAREGRTVERAPRPVHIHQIRVLRMELPRVWIEVSCSKGTYIRTLCHDAGAQLGCGGCMEKLLRTRVGEFEIGRSHTLEQIQAYREKGSLEELLIPIDEVFGEYRKIYLEKEAERLLYNGNSFPFPKEEKRPGDGERLRVYDHQGRFMAVYRYERKTDSCRTEKIFFSGQDL